VPAVRIDHTVVVYGAHMEQSNRRVLVAGGLAGLVALVRRRRKNKKKKAKGRCCASGTLAWPDAPAWNDAGQMTNVDDFNAFVEDARPCYRHYPESSAQAVLGMDPTGASPQAQFLLRYGPGAGSGETDVVITIESLGDDSVEATRYLLTFGDETVLGDTPGRHRLLAGLREFRCHEGRGHTDWGPELCL
jgi:hypothetical protein